MFGSPHPIGKTGLVVALALSNLQIAYELVSMNEQVAESLEFEDQLEIMRFIKNS